MTYFVDSVVCDYGVFASYLDKFGKGHIELKIICNRRDNALLIKKIMNKDEKGEYGGTAKKVGRWKAKDFHTCYCTNCNFAFDIMKCDFMDKMRFCPNCGQAKMEGAEE